METSASDRRNSGNVIAEYDLNNNLLRKYIYGPRVDEPVCMIDAVANDAEYYYHYDGLGSVVALSDSAGDTVQTYEYSIYGQVAAEDPNFLTNPYMFTGRRFDIETGLYYYRARYYNPHIGRFMQTDPIGYSAGMNLYAYCGNGPLNFVDPSGLYSVSVDIPLQAIWHCSSMGAIIKGKYVTEENDPQHKKDVQGFLDDSNFYKKFPGVTLDSVTFSGSHEEGTYHCVFEVPDDVDEYRKMKMEMDPAGSIEILTVKTSTRRKTNILDWRLIGMLNDPEYYTSNKNITGTTGIISGAVSVISGYMTGVNLRAGNLWSSARVYVPGSVSVISAGVSVVSAYLYFTDPGGNVPNFSKIEDYVDYIDLYDCEKGSVFERYEEYKKKYNL